MWLTALGLPQTTQKQAWGLLPPAKILSGIFNWEKLNRGVSKPGGFPLFSGKVQIVSRTLSGLFLVGALIRPRKRKGTNRENPRTIPEQIGKIPENRESPEKDKKKGRTSPDREAPPFETPRLAALDLNGDTNPGEWHSRATRDGCMVTLCALRAATVLSCVCCADFCSSVNKDGDAALAWKGDVALAERSGCHGTTTDKHCTSHGTPPPLPPSKAPILRNLPRIFL